MKSLKWTSHADLAIRRTIEVERREYLDHMTFTTNERPLFTEIFGPIIGLKEEWEQQGATEAELDFSAFHYRTAERGRVPVNTERNGGYPEQLISETDTLKVWRDGLGRTMHLAKGKSTISIPVDHPVKDMDDWLKIKPWYEFCESRFNKDWEAITRQFIQQGKVVTVSIAGGFDEPRQLLGEEGACVACYEDPELIHDILETIGNTARQVLDRVSSTVPVDVLSVHEDMAGGTGPLWGPEHVRQFILPYYRKVWDMLSNRGTRLFDQDSDGDMRPLIDVFLEAGVNCMHPMEPAANMDVVAIREQYGTRLAFYGGIDKHVLRQSKQAIAKELEYKIPPLLKSGGCVFALDHRIPNGTPLENYRFYIDTVWQMLEPNR